MFFSKSENEVWMELKPDSCCCKNLKDYYSRKCTLNQSNKKVLQFFHNTWHEKCSNFKLTFHFFYGKRWFNWLFLTSIDRKGSYISDVWWIYFYEYLKLKIFIFCIRVTKFYSFSWHCSYTNYLFNVTVTSVNHLFICSQFSFFLVILIQLSPVT